VAEIDQRIHHLEEAQRQLAPDLSRVAGPVFGDDLKAVARLDQRSAQDVEDALLAAYPELRPGFRPWEGMGQVAPGARFEEKVVGYRIAGILSGEQVPAIKSATLRALAESGEFSPSGSARLAGVARHLDPKPDPAASLAAFDHVLAEGLFPDSQTLRTVLDHHTAENTLDSFQAIQAQAILDARVAGRVPGSGSAGLTPQNWAASSDGAHGVTPRPVQPDTLRGRQYWVDELARLNASVNEPGVGPLGIAESGVVDVRRVLAAAMVDAPEGVGPHEWYGARHAIGTLRAMADGDLPDVTMATRLEASRAISRLAVATGDRALFASSIEQTARLDAAMRQAEAVAVWPALRMSKHAGWLPEDGLPDAFHNWFQEVNGDWERVIRSSPEVLERIVEQLLERFDDHLEHIGGASQGKFDFLSAEHLARAQNSGLYQEVETMRAQLALADYRAHDLLPAKSRAMYEVAHDSLVLLISSCPCGACAPTRPWRRRDWMPGRNVN
jgi:hypothetical protein